VLAGDRKPRACTQVQAVKEKKEEMLARKRECFQRSNNKKPIAWSTTRAMGRSRRPAVRWCSVLIDALPGVEVLVVGDDGEN
jgi:hypothetical protein